MNNSSLLSLSDIGHRSRFCEPKKATDRICQLDHDATSASVPSLIPEIFAFPRICFAARARNTSAPGKEEAPQVRGFFTILPGKILQTLRTAVCRPVLGQERCGTCGRARGNGQGSRHRMVTALP
jgi:hypothetical protein